jgi:hypothetical protein
MLAAMLTPATLAYAGNQALRGGLTVNLDVTSSDTAVGTITTSPVEFAGGAFSAFTASNPAASGTSTIALGTPAGFSTPNNFQQITATVTAPNISFSNVTVGRDLQVAVSVTLDSAPPSPVDVTIQSNAAGTVTVSNDAALAGTDTIVFEGVSSTFVGTIYVQGRAIGSTTVTAQAEGYNPRSASVQVQPSGFILNTSSFTTNTFQANTSIQVLPAILNPTTLQYAGNQPVRGGLTVNVPVTSSDDNVGVITTSPLAIGPNSFSGSTAFDPKAAGEALITVGVPTGFQQPANFTQITATVTAPSINIGNFTIGRDLQVQTSVSLAATPPSPVTVTVRTNAPGVATISQAGNLEGGQTIVFTNVTTANVGTIFIQGRSLGTTTITAEAAGYNDGTGNVTVNPSGFIFNTSSFTTNLFAGNSALTILPSVLDANLNYAGNQAVRGGLTVNVPLVVANPSVGVLTANPVAVGANSFSGATAFDPVGIGSTQITLGTPAGFSTPGNFQVITATVQAPAIFIGNVTVGKDLQEQRSVTLESAPPSPVTVTVRTGSALVATISENAALAGGDTITFTNVTGTFVGTISVQGRSVGTTSLTAEATGYAPSTNTVTVDPSGFLTFTGDFTTTAGAGNTNVAVFPVRLDPVTLNYASNQSVRGGLTVDVPVTSSNTNVGTITNGLLSFQAGMFSANTAFDPNAPGITTITVGVPTGFSMPSNFRQITATVGQ